MTGFNLLNHINGKDRTIVIWLFNIGVEKYWNEKKVSIKDSKEDLIVNHIEEITLLITKKQDILILRNNPDIEYLSDLQNEGYEIPYILCPEIEDEDIFISELVLKDNSFKKRLDEVVFSIKQQMYGDLAEADVVFVPYGISELEEEVARKLDIQMFGASSDICKMINDKVYARKLAIDNNFVVPDGFVCTSIEEVEKQARNLLEKYEKIIIKEPCGASGKGLWVVNDDEKLSSVILILKRFLRKIPDFRILVEQWCDKRADLNYQIYIGENSDVNVFSIKQQLLDETVYIGSLIPPNVSADVIEQCKAAGLVIGRELRKQGYIGVVGVDAILLDKDVLVPIIEINARFTLSTYLSFLRKTNVLAFYKRINLKSEINYSVIKNMIKKAGLKAFIYVSETVNGRRLQDVGRLFCLVSVKSAKELDRLIKNN